MKKSLFFFITFFTALGLVGYNSVFGVVPTENSSEQNSSVEEKQGDPADESAALVVRKEQNDQSKIAKPRMDLGRVLSSTFADNEELKRQFLYFLLFQSLSGGTSYGNNPFELMMVKAFENSILKNSGLKNKFIGMLNSQLSNSDSGKSLINNIVVNNDGSNVTSNGKSKKWRSCLWRGTKEFVENTASWCWWPIKNVGGYTIKHIVPPALAGIFIVGLGVTAWNNAMPLFGDKLPINGQNVKRGLGGIYNIWTTGAKATWGVYNAYKGVPLS